MSESTQAAATRRLWSDANPSRVAFQLFVFVCATGSHVQARTHMLVKRPTHSLTQHMYPLFVCVPVTKSPWAARSRAAGFAVRGPPWGEETGQESYLLLPRHSVSQVMMFPTLASCRFQA